MYWKEDLQSLGLYWRAIRDFGVVFHAWIIIGGLLIIDWVRQRKQIILSFKPKQLFWLFLIGITGFNFIIHSWQHLDYRRGQLSVIFLMWPH